MPLSKSLLQMPENTEPKIYDVTYRTVTCFDVQVTARDITEATEIARTLWDTNRQAFSGPRTTENVFAEPAEIELSL